MIIDYIFIIYPGIQKLVVFFYSYDFDLATSSKFYVLAKKNIFRLSM